MNKTHKETLAEITALATAQVAHMEDGTEKYHAYWRSFNSLKPEGFDPMSELNREEINSRFD